MSAESKLPHTMFESIKIMKTHIFMGINELSENHSLNDMYYINLWPTILYNKVNRYRTSTNFMYQVSNKIYKMSIQIILTKPWYSI